MHPQTDLLRRIPALLSLARKLLDLPEGPCDCLGPREIPAAARAVARLHEGLVGARALAAASTYDRREHLGAYLLWWWPPSYLKSRAALELAPLPLPPRPRILDLGAGPGPASCAALDALGGDALALDASAAALSLARALASGEGLRTQIADFRLGLPRFDRCFDLVICAHLLSELPEERRVPLVQALPLKAAAWSRGSQEQPRGAGVSEQRRPGAEQRTGPRSQEGGAIVLVEPALRETGRALLRLRDALLSSGSFEALAPCLTQRPCPALASPRDWCTSELSWEPPPHIVQLAREVGLRADERLSYAPLVLAVRAPAPPKDLWRVVGAPPLEKGRRRLFVCSDEGRVPLTRLDKEATARNSAFAQLGRGDLVRLRGLTERGDGLRVGPDSEVVREPPRGAGTIPTSNATAIPTSTATANPTSTATATANPTSTATPTSHATASERSPPGRARDVPPTR